MAFRVSVVIPAYNVEKFIEKAILSALEQSEVTEVIVVNDGSTDDTLKKIESIRKNNFKVKLFNHENLTNKGRSASRNLAISKAGEDYVAFLDADDYYLKNRFKNDKKILLENPNIDGIYNAIGVHFYREFEVFEKKRLELTSLSKKIKPENLFETLLEGKHGHFSIDGLTVKRSVFDKSGMFNESLEISEDTEIIWKMSLSCKLISGLLDRPVANRGVHGKNVFNKKDLYESYDLKLYESLYFWSSKNSIGLNRAERVLERIWILVFKHKKGIWNQIWYWLNLNLKAPKYLFSYLSLKYCPLVMKSKKLFSV